MTTHVFLWVILKVRDGVHACSGLLQSGLGRLGIGQSMPLPGQHSTIIFFMLGGISMAEVRAVRQEVLKHASNSVPLKAKRLPSVYVGGTHLLTAQTFMHALMHT